MTADSIYEVPLMLEEAGLGEYIVRAGCDLPRGEPDLAEWLELVEQIKQPKQRGARSPWSASTCELHDAYLSVREALLPRRRCTRTDVDVQLGGSTPRSWSASAAAASCWPSVDGIVVPGGFGYRGIEGKIMAARYAREHKVPYLGLCLGMQVMVDRAWRATLIGSDEPNSTEFDPHTPYPVIDLMPEQRDLTDMGGTMRLGVYPCRAGARHAGGRGLRRRAVQERHRHRFEFNNEYRDLLGGGRAS